jgi:hypothetical protein
MCDEDINDLEHVCIIMVVRWMKVKKNKVFDIICSATRGTEQIDHREIRHVMHGFSS